MKSGLLFAVLFALLLPGCAGNHVPVRRDTAAALELQHLDLSRLSAAIVMSDKTRESMDYNKGLSTIPAFTPQAWFNGMARRLQTRFKSAVRSGSVERAQAAGTDIIVVVDNYASVRVEGLGQRFEVEMAAIFLTPDLQKIDVVHGEPLNKAKMWGYRSADKAVAEVEASFNRALNASGKLAAYAKGDRPIPSRAASAPHPADPVGPSTVAPSYQLAERPDDFAIIVGIESYKELPKAQFAEHDAKTVAAHIHALGVPQRHIILLSDSDASGTSLTKYLDSWLPRNVKPTSRVFFYFSGHGAPDAETGEAYLVPWDGDPSFLPETAYPLKRLYDNLGKLKSKEVLVALDACFSGAGGRSVLAKGMRPLVTKVDLALAPSGKITTLTAAASNEVTSTLQEKGHGIFTYFLLEGLNGKAADTSGQVTARSLYDYLKPKVQDEARLQNREQTPTYHSESDVVLRTR